MTAPCCTLLNSALHFQMAAVGHGWALLWGVSSSTRAQREGHAVRLFEPCCALACTL